MPTDEEAAIRDRLAKLAAEGRHVEREAVAWQLADYVMRGPAGFTPQRRLIQRPAPRMRYPIIEASRMLANDSNEGKKLSEFFLVIRPHQSVAELMAECPKCGAIGSFSPELAWRLNRVSCAEGSASMQLTEDDLRGLRSQLPDTMDRIDRLIDD